MKLSKNPGARGYRQLNSDSLDPDGGMFNDWLRFDAVMLINTCCAFKGIISISFPIFIEKSDR